MIWCLEASTAHAGCAQQPSLLRQAAGTLAGAVSFAGASHGPFAGVAAAQLSPLPPPSSRDNGPDAAISALYWCWATELPDNLSDTAMLQCCY